MTNFLTAIDASLNRALEGVRVCEDILRFVLKIDDSQRFKNIRHDLKRAVSFYPPELLLSARDVSGDKQKFVDLKSEKKRGSLSELFQANIHRAQEALRSLEEFSKLEEDSSSEIFQDIRFQLYELEKEIIPIIIKTDKREKFRKSLYGIVDSSFIKEDYHKTIEDFAKGGVDILQLRMKNSSSRDFLKRAKSFVELCRSNGILSIINDSIDIAIITGADGIHLGQDDIPYNEARKIMPEHMVIGISTHSIAQAQELIHSSVDYIAIGPVYDTKTKTGSVIKGIGLEAVRDISRKTKIPLVAIGGISEDEIEIVLSAGYDSIAMISELFKNSEIEKNSKIIKGLIEKPS